MGMYLMGGYYRHASYGHVSHGRDTSELGRPPFPYPFLRPTDTLKTRSSEVLFLDHFEPQLKSVVEERNKQKLGESFGACAEGLASLTAFTR